MPRSTERHWLLLVAAWVLAGCSPERGRVPGVSTRAPQVTSAAGADKGAKTTGTGAPVAPEFVPELLRLGEGNPLLVRIGSGASWGPLDCRIPDQMEPLVDRGRSSGPHGRKLYFLLVSHERAYRRGGTQPVGQLIVKESWHPRPLEPGAEPRPLPGAHTLLGGAQLDGKTYVPGEKGPLFVMRKLDPQTAGTDRGWVYATLTPKGDRVTAAGRLPSCMRCHEKQTQDRLFRPLAAISRRGGSGL